MISIKSTKLRQALRAVSRALGFVVVVVVLMSIGVGANSAVVQFASRLFWEWPSGISHPESVKRLYVLTRWTPGNLPVIRPTMKYAWYHEISSSNEVGSASAADTRPDSFYVEDQRGSRTGMGSYATPSYWSLLGVQAERGHLFDSTEDRMGNPTPVVVISHSTAIEWFGRTDSVIGQTVRLNGTAYTIIGIANAGFFGTDLRQTGFWLPIASYDGGSIGNTPWYDSWRASSMLRVLLREGHSLPDGHLPESTELVRRGELANVPADPDTTATILTGSLRETQGPSLTVRPEALISSRLFVVSIGLLLVVYLNIGMLGFVRASRRRQDQAIRVALGASRQSLITDVVLENLIVGLLGAIVAIPTAVACEQLLRATVPNVTNWAPDSSGWIVPAVAAAGSLLAVVALCLPPIAQELRTFRAGAYDLTGARATQAPGAWQLGAVVVQIAVAVALAGGAGLFVQNIRNLRAINVGYDVDDLVLGSGSFSSSIGNASDRLTAALKAISARSSSIVDAQGIALVSSAPLQSYMTSRIFREDHTLVPNVADRDPAIYAVSPEFFAVVGLTVTRGRSFDQSDQQAGAPVVVVNETAARAYWGAGVTPTDQCLVLGAPERPCSRVVGIVHDSHLTRLVEGPRAAVFVPFGQSLLSTARYIIVRTTPAKRLAVARELERLLRQELGPDAFPQVMTMSSLVAPALRPWSLGATLFSLFGAFALLIAAAGVYGVMSSTVEARRRELAIRNALGATWGQISKWLVVTRGVVLAVGLVLGVALALALAQTLRSHLDGIGHLGWASLVIASLVVGAIGGVAVAVPIARATRTNTVELLRRE